MKLRYLSAVLPALLLIGACAPQSETVETAGPSMAATTTEAPTTTTAPPRTTTTTTPKRTTTTVDPAEVFELVVRAETGIDVDQATEFALIVCQLLGSGESLATVSKTVVEMALQIGFDLDQISELGTITGSGIYAFCPQHAWQIGA